MSILDLSRVGMKPAGWRGCDAKHAEAASRCGNHWSVGARKTKATESCNQLATIKRLHQTDTRRVELFRLVGKEKHPLRPTLEITAAMSNPIISRTGSSSRCRALCCPLGNGTAQHWAAGLAVVVSGGLEMPDVHGRPAAWDIKPPATVTTLKCVW